MGTAQTILDSLTEAHKDVPVADSWAFDPEASLRSVVGYVGLRNMGCTCYMNRFEPLLLTVMK
jgi:ubiquitin C-terminal hydrolase